MAHYQVAYSCGHTSTIQLTGPIKQRESRIAWLQRAGDCDNCKRAHIETQRAEAVSAAQAFAAEAALPALDGTPKQTAWAEQLRGKVMPDALAQRAAIVAMAPAYAGNARAETAIGMALAAIDRLSRQSSAKWWIDNARDAIPPRAAAVRFLVHDDPALVANAKQLIMCELKTRAA